MSVDRANLSPDDVVGFVATAVGSDEKGNSDDFDRRNAERRLSEWANSQPTPADAVGPAPNC